MTNSEFSNQFDVLYNNIMSNQAPGLDDYEKSVFLTKAQDEIIKAYFNPKGNKHIEGFDDSAERQADFSMLIETEEITTFDNSDFDGRVGSKSVTLPTDAMIFINEKLLVSRNSETISLVVVPISYDEYSRLMARPYKRPLQYQAWRMVTSKLLGSSTKHADLIAGPNDIIVKYVVRYVKRPQPIVLTNLEGGLTINGQGLASSCELDPILHEDILQRAVELAKAVFTGDLSSQIALGMNSATEKGTLPMRNYRQ